MFICTRHLARVHPFRWRHALPILREHFRLNRQDFDRGWNYAFTAKRRRPTVRELPLVPVDAPTSTAYSSRYLAPSVAFSGPVAVCTLDRV